MSLALRSVLVLPLLLGSCTTERFYDDRYQPAPLEVEVGTQVVAGSQVRCLVSVIGIERPAEGHGARAVVRMRLENLGTVPAKLETESLSLVSADLAVFGPVQVASVDPPAMASGEIGPGASASIDLLFALPGETKTGGMDLSGLNLRFTLRFGEHAATAGATFRRLEYLYMDPWYGHVSVGVGYCSD